MTREEAAIIIKECKDKGFKHTFYTLNEYHTALDMAIKALEQEPCEDAISRQAVLTLAKEECDTAIIPYRRFVKDINALPPVTPQPKMGCDGCIYEKMGNNSTYPCSHCGRCYTDKYKAESEE